MNIYALLSCPSAPPAVAVGNEEGHNEFEDFPVGHVFYVGRLWGRVLCVDAGGGAGGEAGFGAAVGGAVVSAEPVALPAAVAEGQREGRAVVDVIVAEFVLVGPPAFVAVGQLVFDGDRFFHDVSGGEPVFLPCAGAGEVFDGAPAFDQSVVVFAEWAVCCVAVAAVVAQVLIWDRRSLLFLRAGLCQRAAPTVSPQGQAGAVSIRPASPATSARFRDTTASAPPSRHRDP